MKDTSTVEEIRLANLKLLHGSATDSGAPTSGNLAAFLSSKNVHITTQKLSDIYHRKESIDIFLAANIERAFGVPEGWLSKDQSFLRTVTPEELLVLKAYTQLPTSLKSHISAIIQHLGDMNQ